MQIIKGISVVPGIAFGRPCFYQEKIDAAAQSCKTNPADSHTLLFDAFNKLTEQLNALAVEAEACLDQAAAGIFHAHSMICAEMQEDVLKIVRHGQMDLREAIEKCFDDYSDYFSGLSNTYFNERGNDFTELKQLLLSHLNDSDSYLVCRENKCCGKGVCAMKNEHVLVTGELTASRAIRLGEYTRGIIAEKCGEKSHAAVIARARGIPVISGIKDPFRLISLEDNLLIDGDRGEIIINPCEVTLTSYRTRFNLRDRLDEVVEPLPQFQVLADIERCDDVTRAIGAKADGIGLYRTEFEMFDKDCILGETEQIECYQHVMEKMNGKPVYFRLFDLGSDKSAPWLGQVAEDNPALGCRGARFLLSRPELLRTQARALAEVSRIAPINVIYPMICGVEQFLELKRLFEESISAVAHGQIRHGIMFEVPSACLLADELYKKIDFGRIGSNDLVQYLFACDRTSNDVCHETLLRDRAVWKLMADLTAAARKAGKPLELCGTMADNPEFIPALIDLGITTISTRPENIAATRKAASACLCLKPQLCLI